MGFALTAFLIGFAIRIFLMCKGFGTQEIPGIPVFPKALRNR